MANNYIAQRINKSGSKKPMTKKPSRKTPSFTKQVQQVISANAETKCEAAVGNNTQRDGQINAQSDIIYLLPNIAKGTSANQRIGDQIRGQKLNIKGHVLLQTTLQSLPTSRIGVRIMIVSSKVFRSIDVLNINWTTVTAALLKQGSTTKAFTGLCTDLYTDINTDLMTVHYDKVLNLTLTPSIATAGTTSVNTVQTPSMTGSFAMFSHQINLRNKQMLFDSAITTGIYPTNYAPILLVGWSRLDGSAATADTLVSLSYISSLYWEDV